MKREPQFLSLTKQEKDDLNDLASKLNLTKSKAVGYSLGFAKRHLLND